MKLGEYLQIRKVKVPSLSVAEGKTMGIDPTRKGWMQFCKTVEVPQRLVDAALAGADSKQLRAIAREMNACGFQPAAKHQNPPRPGSLAPLKKMEPRHLLAATKYLQERGRLIEMGNKPASFVVVARELHCIYQDAPGFTEKYGQGQDGLRRMVIDFFDDAPVATSPEEVPDAPRLTKSERRKQAIIEAKKRKSNTKVAAEVRAHRAASKRRTPSIQMTVEGVDVRSKEFLSTYAWRNLRIKALNLYGRKCMCCGDTPENGAVMNIDHIRPRKHYPELALDIRWLQCLCGACNHGKGNELENDYRTADQKRAAEVLARSLFA